MSDDWSAVALLTASVDAALDRWLTDEHRVGLTDYRALTHLARALDKELRVNDLADRMGLNQSSTTRLVSRLESKGLARRDLCADDRRGVYAVITPAGEKLVRRAGDEYGERVRDALERAGASDRTHPEAARFADALEVVAAVLRGRRSD